MRPPSIAIRLPASPDAAGTARRSVEELSEQIPSAAMENLRLLISELVTNSVRHAQMPQGGDILLEVHVSPARVRVDVLDGGAGFEVPSPPDPVADGGWGLYLVDAIASRWGATRGATSSVWFELDL